MEVESGITPAEKDPGPGRESSFWNTHLKVNGRKFTVCSSSKDGAEQVAGRLTEILREINPSAICEEGQIAVRHTKIEEKETVFTVEGLIRDIEIVVEKDGCTVIFRGHGGHQQTVDLKYRDRAKINLNNMRIGSPEKE